MDENGTFIFADAAEAKKAKQPMNEQAEKLIALSQKDYDPIFGESYEPFVAAYMQAMAAVAELVRPKEKDASADAKAWAEKARLLARSGVSKSEGHDGRLAGDGRGMRRI